MADNPFTTTSDQSSELTKLPSNYSNSGLSGVLVDMCL